MEYELDFDEKACEDCPAPCLYKCPYLDIDKDSANDEMMKIIRGEDSFVLEECATCYSCEEFCPKGNHPFYLINERMEEKGILPAARPIAKQWKNMSTPKGKFLVGEETGGRAMSFCHTNLGEFAEGKLFEELSSSYVLGAEFFCQVVFIHFGKPSIIKERLPNVIERIADQGIDELICLHDECYGAYSSLAPAYGMEVPFEPVHYFDYLLEKLEEFKGDITPLDLKVAYQRPCSNRLCPEKHPLVEDIFDMIGVETVDRKYQDEKARCCGPVLRMANGFEFGRGVQKENINDMAENGAEYSVFNCPYCQMALSDEVSKKGIKPIHIIDLCRMAIGEEV